MKNILCGTCLYSFLLLLLVSCKRYDTGSCLYAYQPPNGFFFVIKKGGQPLPNQILDSVKIGYIENSVKKYVTDLSYAVDYYANKGILATRNIGFSSGDNGIKIYFLEYTTNLKADTLYIDYTKPSISNGCVYVLNQVRFNDKVTVTDTAFKYQPVYLFDKN